MEKGGTDFVHLFSYYWSTHIIAKIFDPRYLRTNIVGNVDIFQYARTYIISELLFVDNYSGSNIILRLFQEVLISGNPHIIDKSSLPRCFVNKCATVSFMRSCNRIIWDNGAANFILNFINWYNWFN